MDGGARVADSSAGGRLMVVSDAVSAVLDGDEVELSLVLSGADAAGLARAVNSAVYSCCGVDAEGVVECLVEKVTARKVGVYLSVSGPEVLRLFVDGLIAAVAEGQLVKVKLDVQRSSMAAFWDNECPAVGVLLSDGTFRPSERPGGSDGDPAYGGPQPSWMRSAIEVVRGLLVEISGSNRVQIFIQPDHRNKAFRVTPDSVYAELDGRAVADPAGTVRVLLECGGRTAIIQSDIEGIKVIVDLRGSDSVELVERMARRLEVLAPLVDPATEYSAMFVVARRDGIGYDRTSPGYEESFQGSRRFMRDGVGWPCWVQWIDEGLAARLGPPARIGPTDRTLTRVEIGELGEWLDFGHRAELLDVVEAVIEPARLTTELVRRRYREWETANKWGSG